MGAFKTEPFIIFWHRAGNTPRGVRAVLEARRHGPAAAGKRPLRHGVELDLKWAAEAGSLLLYAWHGPTGRETLPASKVRAWAARGELTLMEDLLRMPAAGDLHFLIELKRGDGPAAPAIARLAALLAEHRFLDRTLLAASSLALLAEAAALAPMIPRVLFTAHLTRGGRLLHLPKTDIARGLRRGLLVRAASAGVNYLCKLGLTPSAPARHLELGRRAAEQRLAYLPGRVASIRHLHSLAAAGSFGAFAYCRPDDWR